MPTDKPTTQPTDSPTESPTDAPTTGAPTEEPTESPTDAPTGAPTAERTYLIGLPASFMIAFIAFAIIVVFVYTYRKNGRKYLSTLW